MNINPQTVADLVTFGKLMTESRDLDPAYPVLQARQRSLGDDTSRIWHSLLYLAFYNIASAEVVWTQQQPLGLAPTATERRGIRGGIIHRHWESVTSLARTFGSPVAWLMSGFHPRPTPADRRSNHRILTGNYMQAYGNGRWAAYKAGDIFRYVHGWSLEAPDMGMKEATGPRAGLEMVYEVHGLPPERMEQMGRDLQRLLWQAGLTVTIDELETLMCDYHSLRSGRYYVGHDIDLMQEQLLRAEASGFNVTPLWDARRKGLPEEYLGEVQGWVGRDRDLMKVYRDQGAIPSRASVNA